MTDDTGNESTNIVQLFERKSLNSRRRLSSNWVAATGCFDAPISKEEMNETWSSNEQEVGVPTFWGPHMRKAVPLEETAKMRVSAGNSLSEQMALAVGPALIERTSVKDAGGLIEATRTSRPKIDTLIAKATNKVWAQT